MSNAVGQAIACLGMLVFAAAVAGKLDSWADWVRLTAAFPGGSRTQLAARLAIPIAEATIVALCIFLPAGGLAAAAVLLALFAIAVRALAGRLGGRECNCFGAIAPARISPRLAARNAGMAVFAAIGSYAVSRTGVHAISVPAVLLTAVVGVGLLMATQLRDLRGLAWPKPPVRELRGR